MKRIFPALIIFLNISLSTSLAQSLSTTEELSTILEKSSLIMDDSIATEVYGDLIGRLNHYIDSLKADPDSYDRVWKIVVDRVNEKDSTFGTWLNGLDLDFKTFQTKDSSALSLGVSYDLNIERAWVTENDQRINGLSLSLSSRGNIAFNKKVNPANFLNTKAAVSFFQARGGVILKNKADIYDTYRSLSTKLAEYETTEKILNSGEWKSFYDYLQIKNSLYYSVNINGGLESNQDFSMTQYAFGAVAGFGIKAWDDNNILSWLNIPDYPFALIRKITNYDKKITPNGATIPSLLLGFDYVNPTNDSIRENIEGNLKPYPRFKFEIGFRTVVAKALSQTIYFNSSFMYYMELNASQKIKQASLDKFTYFTASLTSDKGLFVSYAYGKLPFDRHNDAVYQIGFNYKFK